MHMHAILHRVNYSLVGMWAGVALIPAGFLIVLFAIAHLL